MISYNAFTLERSFLFVKLTLEYLRMLEINMRRHKVLLGKRVEVHL